MVFVGRRYELERLEDLRKREGVKTCLIYGKKRVGKSELISQFCKDKRSICFEYTTGSLSSQLKFMADVFSETTGRQRDDYDMLYRSLKDIADYCRESETVVVFDEFQYLVGDDEKGEISSEFQRFVDTLLKGTDTMVIICGSYASMMIELTSDPRRPLYGRFPNSIELEPLSLKECSELHPNLCDLDVLRLYLTIGGFPGFHVEAIGDTYEECIWNAFLRKQAPLQKDVQLLIGCGMSNVEEYRSILRVISEGSVTNKTIAEKTNMERMTCRNQLQRLLDSDILGIHHPMYGAPKHPRYYIKEDAVAFYYGVYESNRMKIDSKMPAETLNKLAPSISTYLGLRFEFACMNYLRNNYYCTEIGRWWGASKTKGNDGKPIVVDIDVTAKVESGSATYYIFGECKMRNRLTGFHELNELIERTELTKTEVNPTYMLFSTSGFDDDLLDYASISDNVKLVNLDQIMGNAPAEPL